jgi:hypothetical protein
MVEERSSRRRRRKQRLFALYRAPPSVRRSPCTRGNLTAGKNVTDKFIYKKKRKIYVRYCTEKVEYCSCLHLTLSLIVKNARHCSETQGTCKQVNCLSCHTKKKTEQKNTRQQICYR